MNRCGETSKVCTCGTLLVAGLLMAGCSQGAKPAGPTIANGTWASSDGVYSATFSNGRFRATANDTGELLSEGRYIVKSDSSLRIEWQGNVTRTANSAECTKPNTEEMSCVDQNGKNFSLKRTSKLTG